MDIVQSITLGLIEGITEFLPISSTAHLIITNRIINVPVSTIFEITIQSGAMLAVIFLYISELKSVIRDSPKIIVAFLPTLLVGILAFPLLSNLYNNLNIIILALAVGGLLMILIPTQPINKIDSDNEYILSWKQSLQIGFAQIFAVIPGVSRSGAIFILGELKNIPRVALVRFSFLLGAGTIFSASIYSLLKSQNTIWQVLNTPFLIAFFVAGISAWFSCKWLLSYMSKAPLAHFGWYRLILAMMITIIYVI